MSKRILLAIDANASPTTLYLLRVIGELIEHDFQAPHMLLLHVIPIPYATSPSLGMYIGQIQPAGVTPEQRTQGEEVLRNARKELIKLGIDSDKIEVILRVGSPAEEVNKLAREQDVDLVVVGCRGFDLKEKVRRSFFGSTSHRILQIAPCPVMVVTLPKLTSIPSDDLIKWYTEALTRYLQEHQQTLTVLTPKYVATTFLPHHKKTVSSKELAAARIALEKLTQSGQLFRHEVKGEERYVND